MVNQASALSPLDNNVTESIATISIGLPHARRCEMISLRSLKPFAPRWQSLTTRSAGNRMWLSVSACDESSGHYAAIGNVQSINKMVSSAGSLVKSKCFMKVSHSIPSDFIDRNLVDRGNDRACVCGRSIPCIFIL
jgi:hypothetical protein